MNKEKNNESSVKDKSKELLMIAAAGGMAGIGASTISSLSASALSKILDKKKLAKEVIAKNERLAVTGEIMSRVKGLGLPSNYRKIKNRELGKNNKVVNIMDGYRKKSKDGLKEGKIIKFEKKSFDLYVDVIEKIAYSRSDNADRDSETRTRLWRDRVKPELKRGAVSLPIAIGSGIATSKLNKNSKMSILGGMAGLAGTQMILRHNADKKLKDRYGDILPKSNSVANNYIAPIITSAQYLLPVPGNKGVMRKGIAVSTSLSSSPEAAYQKARRENEIHSIKEASDLYIDVIEKIASEEYSEKGMSFKKKLALGGLAVAGASAIGMKYGPKLMNSSKKITPTTSTLKSSAAISKPPTPTPAPKPPTENAGGIKGVPDSLKNGQKKPPVTGQPQKQRPARTYKTVQEMKNEINNNAKVVYSEGENINNGMAELKKLYSQMNNK